MKNLVLLFICCCFMSCNGQEDFRQTKNMEYKEPQKSDTEWKAQLTDEQYRVLREKGTEAPHTGQYNLHFENGTYRCAGCNAKLFESGTKFKSNCGWPSFDEAIEGSIKYKKDKSFGMIRTEIVCAKCGGHLGHVFEDGPTETGKRFCINSASLQFDKP